MSRIILFLFTIFLISCQSVSDTPTPPNVVIIFLDDSGYGDFTPFGKKGLETPGVAQLAAEGCSYDNFYVPQAICSASRAALLTGCYPGRTKVFSAHPPKARGLDTIYPTMGELFKAAGYSTAIFGKWHLGDQEDTRPHKRGFDESAGLMYSNDMWKHHPENPEYWGQFPIQFWENGAVTIEDVGHTEQAQLTKWYTEKAVDFIERKKDQPFLLYVPHSMPHVPLYVSEAFEGKSGQGLYADVLLELDWSVQQINQALKDNGLEENTIVVFTSDNGPWIAYGNHAGVTPFREAKATSFDGGIRSACILKYPPAIEAGTRSDRTFFSIDLLPTLAALTGVALPEQPIDGKDVFPLITNQANAQPPQEYYAFSNGNEFQGVMSGDGQWKLHIPHAYRTLAEDGGDGLPGKYEQQQIDTALYNLREDPFETNNLLREAPEVAQRLLEFAAAHRAKFYGEE
jgi:arylsulfatase A-like enzyme